MSDRVHALAFNALGEALGNADVFVRLSDREAITAAVVTAVRNELAAEMEREAQKLWRDYSAHEMARSNGMLRASKIARGER